jgi:chromosome segregation protein
LAGELKAVERLWAADEAASKGVQLLLDADLEGVLGPLAALVVVPVEWERALEAALGSDLHAVVFEHASAVEEAHRILRAQGGRATVVPLDAQRVPPEAGRMPEGALSAAGQVICEERLRPAVEALLCDVALCEDLTAATALLPNLPPGGRCVTRDGVVVRADGAVVVGRADASGRLAGQGARAELPARLETVRERLEALTAKRQTEGKRADALQARLDDVDRQIAQAHEEARRRLQEQLGEARTAVAVAEETVRSQTEALRREEAELERLRAQGEGLRQQATELQAQHILQLEQARAFRMVLAKTGSKTQAREGEDGDRPQLVPELAQEPAAEAFREQLLEAQHQAGEIERQYHAQSERVASLDERLQRVRQQAAEAIQEAARFEREQLSAARTAVAVTGTSLRSERQAWERESALLERVRSQIEARRERAEELKAEREGLLERIDALREQASRFAAELQSARTKIRPAEDELEELDRARTSLESRRREAQNRVRTAEERFGRARLQVERRQGELSLLADRIEEDLGLVELELADSVTAQTPLPMRPVVSELPVVEQLPDGLRDEMQLVTKRLRRIGAVNPNAPTELSEVRERYDFLTEQAEDLREATDQLRHTVSELDGLMQQAFSATFDAVAERFSEMFSDLFQGGQAHLTLTEPDDLLNTGVEIYARPPGKRTQRLALLSGGERALTAVALLFSLVHISPTPFCVLDEVDAMLDEANVGRFRAKLENLAQDTQFIIITHNRSTVESADSVYGVSMGSNAVSQVVSLRLGEMEGEGQIAA